MLGSYYYLSQQPTMNIPNFVGISLGISLGVLLPDIDSENSTISKMIPIIRFSKKGNGPQHRRLPHTPLFIGIITMVIALLSKTFLTPISQEIYLIAVYFSLGLGLGMLSHLHLDGFTPLGIAWFYPIVKKKYRVPKFLRVTTGSKKEVMVRYLIIAFNIGLSVFLRNNVMLISYVIIMALGQINKK